MVRPKWLVALVFALAVAAAFAALGQWQLQRAVESGTVVQRPTETVIPLTKAAAPNADLRTEMVGQLVTTTGTFAPHDYHLLEGRLNDGATGYWVVARFTLTDADAAGRPVELAVARGWAPDRAAAERAVAELAGQPATRQTITGRLLPTEAPTAPGAGENPYTMRAMSTAALYNLWTGVDGADVYTGYVVQHGTAPAGLVSIYSPPPLEQATLDWLNVFYALEWAVFACFAVFLWYRVARDAWEREEEDAEAAEAAAAVASAPPPVA
ncbi:MAG: SURF1 family protein [Microbacteriaceae bacterium]|nr:MAG: SURF1 family protein [Microbacteriaceae bacterium]